jgi:hypothetical protein
MHLEGTKAGQRGHMVSVRLTVSVARSATRAAPTAEETREDAMSTAVCGGVRNQGAQGRHRRPTKT